MKIQPFFLEQSVQLAVADSLHVFPWVEMALIWLFLSHHTRCIHFLYGLPLNVFVWFLAVCQTCLFFSSGVCHVSYCSLDSVPLQSKTLLCLGGFSVSVVWGCASVVICMFWTLVLCWRSGLQGESPKIKTVKQSPIDSKGKIKRRMKKSQYA